MELASMLEQTSDHAVDDRTAVHGYADLLVGYATEMVDAGRVEQGLTGGCPTLVPPIEDGLRQSSVQEALETRMACLREAQECGVSGLSDADVVGVAGDPIGPERAHDVWRLLLEDGCEPIDELIEGHLVN
jgi:hypothetical protein